VHDPPDRLFEANEILVALADHGVDFVVIGGIAVQVHGYIRGTYDVDIIVDSRTLNTSRLSEALAALEAEIRTPGTLKLTDPHQLRKAPLVPIITKAGPLDVLNVEHVLGGPRSYEALRDAAIKVELRGRQIAVAGLSDLIRMKRAAGREQDLMDIEALTREPEST
jgi:predicted nucleotidyltransferase